MMTVKTIILAAGQGTRMRSAMPKVLHQIGGQPLLSHVYELARQIHDNQIVIVYGFGGNSVRSKLKNIQAEWVEQKERLGTGHAVMQAAPLLNDDDTVLILYGDVPLLKKATVDQLLENSDKNTLALLTVDLENPFGYGRIVSDINNNVQKIVEEKDTDDAQKRITEVNTGILAVNAGRLKTWLSRLDDNNVQKEFYLTDIIAMAVSEGVIIQTAQPKSVDEVLGVNNKLQLSHLERVFQRGNAMKLMEQGVTLIDPSRFDLRGNILDIGEDVEIDVNVVLEGDLTIGNRVKIWPNTIIKNSTISDDVEIFSNCVIENAQIGRNSIIGPFARLRPGAKLGEDVHIGNYVEIKKTVVAARTKINHLSYIGDSSIGSDVNIGAGTITCNYDGINKSQTIIEDGAFIGSDTQLIAPVRVARNSTVAAGSTITKDTPADTLTISRPKQISIKSWRRPRKKRN